MSTPLSIITRDYLQALVTPQATTQTPAAGDNGEAKPDINQALRVAGVLQTTLDIERLIALFSEQIKPAVHHSAMFYQNDEQAIHVRIGRAAAQQCSYQLVVNDESLGELTLARLKPFAAEEVQRLEYLLCTLVYPLRNALLYRKALHAAHKDPLTGVNNRSTLNETLRREIELARRQQRPLSLIVLDIDHFKRINDTLGHSAGDCVIKGLAERITACIRSCDMLFRYGGEEFVVVLSNTDLDGAALLAERIRKAVEKVPYICNDTRLITTVSLGVAQLGEGENESKLFARADQALYQAKSAGRNCVKRARGEEVPVPV